MDSTAPDTKSPCAERRFKYVRDPLFLACVAAWAVNRLLIKPLAPGHLDFFNWHLNDLICIPFWLPPALWVNRRIGIRRHDATPTFGEIFLHLALWSAFFEIVAPRLAIFQGRPVADPADVMFYALGALAGALFWGLRGARAGAMHPLEDPALPKRGQQSIIVNSIPIPLTLESGVFMKRKNWRK